MIHELNYSAMKFYMKGLQGPICSLSLFFLFSQLPHFINSSLPGHDRMTAQQIDSYFRQELIYKRNERMARRVSALLQRNPNQTYFFAFGAGEGVSNTACEMCLGSVYHHRTSLHQVTFDLLVMDCLSKQQTKQNKNSSRQKL